MPPAKGNQYAANDDDEKVPYPVNIRGTEDERKAWRRGAAGQKWNDWARQVLNDASALNRRFTPKAVEEWIATYHWTGTETSAHMAMRYAANFIFGDYEGRLPYAEIDDERVAFPVNVRGTEDERKAWSRGAAGHKWNDWARKVLNAASAFNRRFTPKEVKEWIAKYHWTGTEISARVAMNHAAYTIIGRYLHKLEGPAKKK